ncbi:MAG: GNAT family N-acetyltransferase [Bacillota bacterium]|nr:GNAT family N-acetyltransferase [Bacillota bacterium]NLJ04019.1 GNAT family N-acetyltransferase [Bacillota bacterium]
MEVRFYKAGEIDEAEMLYAVVASQCQGRWIFVRHRDRDTWEIPAGRKEQGESMLQTARRELYEETGAAVYELREICDYSVTKGDTRYGRVFFADIRELGPLPESEIAELALQEDLPAELTYPEIQPLILKQVIQELAAIVEVREEHLEQWTRLGVMLWPGHSFAELRESFLQILRSPKETAFLCRVGQDYAGFINVSIRVDYVEGSESSPTGYVEGIYVKELYRRQGIAKRLLEQGEAWALSRGCTQMGSDIEADNGGSYEFHTKAGFQEANRLICFIKDIG